MVAATGNGICRRAGLDTLDNFIRLRAATRYTVRCNDAVVKLRRWAKSHWWIPLYRNDYGERTITLQGCPGLAGGVRGPVPAQGFHGERNA
ncbi:MAG: hypothetical protein WB777_26570 [Mycobacterium sp.]